MSLEGVLPALLLLLRRAGGVGEAVAEGQSRVDVAGDGGLPAVEPGRWWKPLLQTRRVSEGLLL